MDANNQYLLIKGTIEDTDPTALRKPGRRSPQKIVIQFFRARLLEIENLTVPRIDTRHDATDCSVLARTVHSLKNQQQRITVRREVKLLQ
jgi:hypothetical protein